MLLYLLSSMLFGNPLVAILLSGNIDTVWQLITRAKQQCLCGQRGRCLANIVSLSGHPMNLFTVPHTDILSRGFVLRNVIL